MNSFLFLYPINDFFDGEFALSGQTSNVSLKKRYFSTLNACIDERYRKKDFKIIYALFDDTSISPHIAVASNDIVTTVGVTLKEHRRIDAYPNPLIAQEHIEGKLVVAGFHVGDCVDKCAQAYHEKGVSTLVDEDLTEYFMFRMKDPSFSISTYPGYNPLNDNWVNRKGFDDYRKDKPWLWTFK